MAGGAVKRKLVEFVNPHYPIQIRGRAASAGVARNKADVSGTCKKKNLAFLVFVAIRLTTNEPELLSPFPLPSLSLSLSCLSN